MFWFKVEFDDPFRSNAFVLRPDTTNTIRHFIPQFAGPDADFFGSAIAGSPQIGEFAALVQVPLCTSPGSYILKWRSIDVPTGDWGGAEPSMTLEVLG